MMVHNHDVAVVRMPVMAVLHDNGFSAGNRRRRNGNRSQRGNDTSKLLHCVLLLTSRMANVTPDGAFPLARIEISERLFSLRRACAKKSSRASFRNRLIHQRIDELPI